MATLESLRERFPDHARDLKVNLQSVLGEGTLSPTQRLGVALAAAAAARNPALAAALEAEARSQAGDAVAEDALAAAALMGMTNIFYRFRHMVGKEDYATLPARLRMQRLAKPAGDKLDFELFCLAVSAVNGCETCVRSHEHVVREGGLTEAQVLDAVRIAATVHGAAVALDRV
jgi:alkyl hydroperoxide reductase subunit D